MNVGIFTSTYLPTVGGIQFLLSWLLKAIDEKLPETGIDRLTFFTPREADKQFLDFNNVKVVEYEYPFASRQGLISFVPRLRRMAQEADLDLIHCHAALPEGICCWALKHLSGVPYVVTCHGVDIAVDGRFNYGNRLKWLPSFLTKRVMKGAQTVTTLSTDMVGYAREAGADPKKIRLVPEGINTGFVVKDIEVIRRTEKIREKYAINRNHTLYLTLSGMRKIKGHEALVRGFAAALKQRKDLRLFMGAHGSETENIKGLVKSMGIEENVDFIGFIEGVEKEAWFNVADVYCNTAFFEPFGIVYVESIQHDMAVLGSIHGGAKDIFKHKESAYLIDPWKGDEIVSGILELSNKDRRENYIEKAKPLLDGYDINRIAEKYLNIYSECQKK